MRFQGWRNKEIIRVRAHPCMATLKTRASRVNSRACHTKNESKHFRRDRSRRASKRNVCFWAVASTDDMCPAVHVIDVILVLSSNVYFCLCMGRGSTPSVSYYDNPHANFPPLTSCSIYIYASSCRGGRAMSHHRSAILAYVSGRFVRYFEFRDRIF